MARDLEARGARSGGREEIAERPREARRIFEKGVVPDPGHLQERRVRPGAQNRAQFFGRRERIARPGHEEERHRRPLQPFGEPVSYTHLTLPTILRVSISMVAVS